MSLVLLALGVAPAVEPAWSELAPWRTWVLVEHVGPAEHVFVLDHTPGLRERCEVAVRGREEPVVHCGLALRSDAGRAPLPPALTRAERRARASLAEVAGVDASRFRELRMDYLGELSRVSFRQVVITEPTGVPDTTVTWAHVSHWDVDVQTGRVDHGVIGSRVGLEPLCSAGMHARCVEGPRVLPFVPDPGWDGHLVDTEADGAQGEQTRRLEQLVREVALAGPAWVAPAPRATAPGLLPPGMDAGASLRLGLDVQRATGERERRELTVELPLNEAAFDGLSFDVPIEGTSARLRVDAHLADADLVRLHVVGPSGEGRALALPGTCRVLRDEGRAVLEEACTLRSMERQVTWVGEGGVERVVLTADGRLLPMLGPSRGPSVH